MCTAIRGSEKQEDVESLFLSESNKREKRYSKVFLAGKASFRI